MRIFARRAAPVELSAAPLPAVAGGYGPGGHGHDVRVWLPGSTRDWATEAGPLWRNSIVGSCINLIARTFPEAPLCLATEDADGGTEIIREGHPMLDLMAAPNPYYTADHMWAGVLLSLKTHGNAYLLKRRDNAGRVRELYWLLPWMIGPRWPRDGSEFVTDYLYRANGQAQSIPIEDVIHFREGLNPADQGRTGLAPLAAQLREIVTDNEASTYQASLLKNGAVPGLIVRPSESAATVPPIGWMEKLANLIERKFGGDDRGRPLVAEGALDIDMVSWSPEQMALDIVRQYPEARICAALNVPPALIGLKSGADQSTYSNVESYNEQFYDRCIVPLKTTIGREIEQQLYSVDFAGEDRIPLHVAWDYSDVECLQEDRDNRAKRVALLVTAGILSPNEARQEMGFAALEDPDMDTPRAPRDRVDYPGDEDTGVQDRSLSLLGRLLPTPNGKAPVHA